MKRHTVWHVLAMRYSLAMFLFLLLQLLPLPLLPLPLPPPCCCCCCREHQHNSRSSSSASAAPIEAPVCLSQSGSTLVSFAVDRVGTTGPCGSVRCWLCSPNCQQPNTAVAAQERLTSPRGTARAGSRAQQQQTWFRQAAKIQGSTSQPTCWRCVQTTATMRCSITWGATARRQLCLI